VPDGVRAQIRRAVHVLGSMSREQLLAVVTADGVVLAANRPLLDLVGRPADDLLESDWAEVMPGWDERVAPWAVVDEPDCHAFAARFVRADGEERWMRVVAVPVMAVEATLPGIEASAALAAWTVFVSELDPGSEGPFDLAACDACLCLFRERGFSVEQ
jgi:PAS domain S-box-containing protein